MYSILSWRAPERSPNQVRVQVGPIWVQQVWVDRGPRTPQWLLRRRVEKATLTLLNRGITQGVYPPDMAPWVEPLGLQAVSTVALRQWISPALLSAHLLAQDLSPAQATVGLIGGHVTPRFAHALQQLALCHRHVLVQANGAEEVCQRLHRYYGVAIQCNPGPGPLRRCDGLIAFTPHLGLNPHVITYDESILLPQLLWPKDWALPSGLSPQVGWSMVSASEPWQENWPNWMGLTAP